jgi:hypothetical protein
MTTSQVTLFSQFNYIKIVTIGKTCASGGRHKKYMQILAGKVPLHSIWNICSSLRIINHFSIFERMLRSMMRRVGACISSYGEHFEHLLQMYSFRYKSKIKCFRIHVDRNSFLIWYVELVPKNVRIFQLHYHLFTVYLATFIWQIADRIEWGRRWIWNVTAYGEENISYPCWESNPDSLALGL